MKKPFFILLFVVALSSYKGYAQFDSQISNYWAIPAYFNPAYAGQSGNLEATILSRMQWVGIKRAPKTTIIAADMPIEFLGKVHGIGASMYNDRVGFFSSTVFAGQYAWKKKLFKGDLSLGIQVGYLQQSFDGANKDLLMDIPDSEDHSAEDEGIPKSKVSGSSIDASFGIFYSKPKWYVGLSVTHLLAPQLDLGESDSESGGYYAEIPRSYYFMAGYNIQLNNPLIELRPSILLKTMEMSSLHVAPDSLSEKINEEMLKAMMKNFQVDVSLRVLYKKQFSAGLSWRNDDALKLSLGAKIKIIEIGYSYDFPISRIVKESTGSHEFYARCIIDLNLNRGKKNKHKSVRIL